MKGRSDDMIILKGVNIFPIQIETILMQFQELGNDYLITLTNEEANDLMTVEVELKEFSDDYHHLQALTCFKGLAPQAGRQGHTCEGFT